MVQVVVFEKRYIPFEVDSCFRKSNILLLLIVVVPAVEVLFIPHKLLALLALELAAVIEPIELN